MEVGSCISCQVSRSQARWTSAMAARRWAFCTAPRKRRSLGFAGELGQGLALCFQSRTIPNAQTDHLNLHRGHRGNAQHTQKKGPFLGPSDLLFTSLRSRPSWSIQGLTLPTDVTWTMDDNGTRRDFKRNMGGANICRTLHTSLSVNFSASQPPPGEPGRLPAPLLSSEKVQACSSPLLELSQGTLLGARVDGLKTRGAEETAVRLPGKMAHHSPLHCESLRSGSAHEKECGNTKSQCNSPYLLLPRRGLSTCPVPLRTVGTGNCGPSR